MINKIPGIAPKPTQDGAFSPSTLALKMATSATTNYDGAPFSDASTGDLKIMMICSEERYMTMSNGKRFDTGNQPVETFVPMLHLLNAGFQIEVYTPTGLPVQMEEWAIPKKDENVLQVIAVFKSSFEQPKSLKDFVSNELDTNDDIIGLFIPGGHGALLGLPENDDLGQILHWAHQKDLHVMSICHGPAALLAAARDTGDFIYNGYKMAAFPDFVDMQAPLIGYLPGWVPWKFGKKLKSLGVKIVNLLDDSTCHVDRKLITGASPKASNKFGKLCAEELIKVHRR